MRLRYVGMCGECAVSNLSSQIIVISMKFVVFRFGKVTLIK
jgi:hypothetical protein